MKKPHLLRVEEGAERFAPLVEAARADGLRVGWLELGSPEDAPPAPVPAGLEEAAALGVLRAVSAGGGRVVAVKPLRGEPVLDDLLREHFRGCALVLVRGPVDAPVLRGIEGGLWAVEPAGAAAVRFDTARLAAALRKPRPWG
jgi:hypothetical protein